MGKTEIGATKPLHHKYPITTPSLRLFVRSMLAATLAELLEFEASRGGLLVFGGGVIAFLAIPTL
jgi:hypothetical protein